MGTVGTKRGTKEVPPEWLESVAGHIEAWIKETGRERLTGRQIAPLLGISQPTLTQLLNKKGGLGLQVLIKLREPLKKSLDQLLGLKPVAGSGLTEDEVLALIREELDRRDAEAKKGRKPG